ncbi:hypothetical LCDV1 paralog family 2 [Lymphocystis disease virus 1]|uniref:hypothetical LCDV1 paralog family 2 n=1 Tax=Fish lymphocystis disease virus TaxID=36363 RepID=UPI0000161EBC|nr:hypothetical LCDV1 paralog family 2 [Lymphocystis disease virus 1]
MLVIDIAPKQLVVKELKKIKQLKSITRIIFVTNCVANDDWAHSWFNLYNTTQTALINSITPELIIFDDCDIHLNEYFNLVYKFLPSAVIFWFIFRFEAIEQIERVEKFLLASKLHFPYFIARHLNRFKILKYSFHEQELYLLYSMLDCLTFKYATVNKTLEYLLELLFFNPMYCVCQELVTAHFKSKIMFLRHLQYYYLGHPNTRSRNKFITLDYYKVNGDCNWLNLTKLNTLCTPQTCILTWKPDFKKYLRKATNFIVYNFTELLRLKTMPFTTIILIAMPENLQRYLFNDDKFKNVIFYMYEITRVQTECKKHSLFKLTAVIAKMFKKNYVIPGILK